ncbi:hypothetical protein ACO0LD_30755 [Undibacterium sp. Ji83W]|uniref:hypothetical protein n=1 Tax=Undibacterium sp. Ji83W TaxID=3413043 RepID=UPI003BEFDE3C
MMQFTDAQTTELDMRLEVASEAWSIFKSLPFNNGRLVCLCSKQWLVQIHQGVVSKRKIPEQFIEELHGYAETPNEQCEAPFRWFPQLFKWGEMTGLLLLDKKIYLLDDFDGDFIEIPIANRLKKWSFKYQDQVEGSGDEGANFLPVACGYTAGGGLPVFYSNVGGEVSNYLAHLSIDVAAKTAQWQFNDEGRAPMIVKYGDYFDVSGYTCFSDASWTGQGYLMYGVGFDAPHFRTGMQFSRLLRVDQNGIATDATDSLLSLDEPCYGHLCADARHLLLKPMYKNKERKGRESLVALDTMQETPLELPKAMKKLKLIDIYDGHAWFVPPVSTDPKVADPAFIPIITCRVIEE